MGAKIILAMLCLCICTGDSVNGAYSNFADLPSTLSSTLLPTTSDTTLSTPEIMTTEMSTLPTPTPTSTPTSTTSVSPTISPTPNPPNPTMNWVVIDEETNVTCIVVKLSASFIVPFHTNSGQVVNATLVLPSNATSNGTCDDLGATTESHNQKITLQWKAGKSDNTNMLTLVFHKNVSSDSEPVGKELVYLSDINFQVYLDSENFPNVSRGDIYLYGELGNSNLHSVAVNNSYRCNSEETIQLSLLEEKDHLTIIHITHMQTEAFRTQIDDKFNSAVDCPADKIITSDIVPIAVGCALAALVVVVLVAYLIGRRRARQRGYQSV